MKELDEAWAQALADAERRARAAGRTDISEYLALRSSNDLIRRTASKWLLGVFATAAGEANRAGAAISISTADAQPFTIDGASMVGSRLSLANGVRLLMVEVGWPRTPRDGFIRGGGLACGNIKHRGIRSANEELRLVLNSRGTPTWIVRAKPERPADAHELSEAKVRNHIALLLSDSPNQSRRR